MIDELMKLANKKATEYNHEYIGTEHVLFALLECSEVDDALKFQGIEPEKIKSSLEKISLKGPDIVITGELPITPRTKKALEYAREIAKENERETPNALDVLNGLFKEMECLAYQVLYDCRYKTIPEKITPESVLLRGGFRIKDNRAYRGDNPIDYVVDLTREPPTIIYKTIFPHLIENALEARKILGGYCFPYNDDPTLDQVIKSLTRDISRRASLIERILELEVDKNI